MASGTVPWFGGSSFVRLVSGSSRPCARRRSPCVSGILHAAFRLACEARGAGPCCRGNRSGPGVARRGSAGELAVPEGDEQDGRGGGLFLVFYKMEGSTFRQRSRGRGLCGGGWRRAGLSTNQSAGSGARAGRGDVIVLICFEKKSKQYLHKNKINTNIFSDMYKNIQQNNPETEVER